MSLKEIFKALYHLSNEDMSILFDNMEKVSFSKNEVILEEGKKEHFIYFVERGIIRNFVLRNGRFVTVWLAAEGEISFLSKLTEVVPAKSSIDAVEDCILWKISKKNFNKLCSESIAFANLGRKLMEKKLSEVEIYWADYYWMDKKKQYQLMIQQSPQLLQRISLTQIAAYLNVTPQSLSRIRGKID